MVELVAETILWAVCWETAISSSVTFRKFVIASLYITRIDYITRINR
jgi:hypothetical protein